MAVKVERVVGSETTQIQPLRRFRCQSNWLPPNGRLAAPHGSSWRVGPARGV
jgi:hypothetical protein